MKRLIIAIAGLISCVCAPAQEYVYLADGQELTITGAVATLEPSGITVGSGYAFDYGNRLLIRNGGYVNCQGSMRVNGTVSTGLNYDWLYSYASISGNGSLLEVGGDLELWSYDLPGRTPGTWDPWGVPSHLDISDGAEVSVDGDISIISGSYMSIRSGGHLRVGSDLTSSEGALNIAANGLLEMHLGEHTSGTRLSVTGDSYLDGTLDILLLDGFTPAHGDEFDLFNWNGDVSGTFAATNTPTLSGGLRWDTSALYTTGTLTVIPEPSSAILIALSAGGGWLVRRFFMI